MISPTFLDTETTGFHGIAVLLQAAIGEEEPQLWCPWTETVHNSLEWMRHYFLNKDGVVGFNLAFDWFHIQKLYNILILAEKRIGKHEFPEEHINSIADLEKEAVFGDCFKPYNALDLMLYSSKNEYQALMNRKDIYIRRLPYRLAELVVMELNQRIVLKDVYFAKKADPTRRWQIVDIKNDLGEVIPDLVDVVLRFAPSRSLKALAIDAGLQQAGDRLVFDDVALNKRLMSNEDGWAPFAKAPFKKKDGKLAYPSSKDWYGRWPDFLKEHIQHWAYNYEARTYAAADIEDTRGLYYHFGEPELGDDDSILACMIGSVRWRGFSIDREKIKQQLKETEVELSKYKFSFNSPTACRKILEQHMSEDMKKLIDSTSKTILEDVAKWKIEDVCDKCFGDGCASCNKTGRVSTGEEHPSAKDAKMILAARSLDKRRGDLNKLFLTERFHPDFIVIGAKSSRMSGAGGLNAQGINSSPQIRSCFTLADENEILSGGDFDAFEVTIADGTYNDPALRQDLLNDHKIHAVFGQYLFDMTYEEVMATKNLPADKSAYALGKRGIFALFYGGNEDTLVRKCGVTLEKAREAYAMFAKKYPVMGLGRQKVIDAHTCVVQEKGIGSKVVWREPDEYVESMFGFKRFFTLENQICRVLFDLANDPPKEWKDEKAILVRRDRNQTVVGATRSALFGAAFNIMSANIRAALNHKIQSTGATPTKSLQKRLWDLQPEGEHRWLVRNMQVHDELLNVSTEEMLPEIKIVLQDFHEHFRMYIPLLNITWLERMSSWSNTH